MARDRLRWVPAVLATSGLALLGLWCANVGQTHDWQAVESEKLEKSLHDRQEQQEERAEGAKKEAKRLARSAKNDPRVLGRIEIPRLRISAMIAEGTSHDALEHAVGHVAWSPHPGERGNVGLAGHRDSFFRALEGVRENDLVRIVTPGGTYDYHVKWHRVVGPREVDVLDPTAAPSLTLVTCYPFRWIGPAPKRFIVRAEQVEPAAALVR